MTDKDQTEINLADMRRQYTLAKLDKKDLDPNPFIQFKSWLQVATDANLYGDPTAMTLATVDTTGQPSQRIVLLKQLDERGFVFYTNFGSRKSRDIAGNSNVSLHFAWLPLERQVSIVGTAKKISIAEASRYFLSRPHESQVAAWASRQSKTIESRKMLDMAVEQIKSRFKKGEVPLPSFWGGYRVAPQSFEFWQGRQQRLHDRFLYSLQSEDNDGGINERASNDASDNYNGVNRGVWTLQRLQP